MTLFGHVAAEYDAGRPSYPDALFDALGPVAGLRVLDVGAGTGLATRSLVGRGAFVVAIDPEAQLLLRAVEHIPTLAAVIADGVRLPVRDRSVDLFCCAQSWHWLARDSRAAEVARVLRTGGRWAGWWSHARADDEQWFDTHWRTIERICPDTHRDQRDIDWGTSLAADGLFDVDDRITIAWRRTLTVNDWMIDLASHSYIAARRGEEQAHLIAALRAVAHDRFPDGLMEIPYETWLWTATKVAE